jgi:biuret amidohydrolase
MPKSALLVLDMQPDIAAFHQGGIEPVVATIKDLIAWARTQSIPIIYSRVAFRPSYVDAFPGAAQMLKPRNMLREDLPGSGIIPELAPQADDIVITKRRVGVFYQTDFELILRSLGSQTLIYTGMSTARVVESTVREAHNRDFQNIVVSDATTATSDELHQAALRSMGDWFAKIKTAAEVKALDFAP